MAHNPAHAASSPALLQEIARAGEQLANASLNLAPAPLQVISLPPHQAHKHTLSFTGPSSVIVNDDDDDDDDDSDGDDDDAGDDEVSHDWLPPYRIPATSIPAVEVPKVVIEYPVPGTRETHEMIAVGNDLLLVTQQGSSTLIKIQLSPTTGRPLSCARFLMDDFWAGLHGLAISQIYPNQVWASLQFKSLIIRMKPGLSMSHTPIVTQVITLPSSVDGPHCVCECGPDVWTGCKDSCHIVRLGHSDPVNDYSIYPCSSRPIFMARHPATWDMYASLDSSSKIWRLVRSTGQTEELEIPEEYGTTPVGLVAGTDGNVWFTLLGGSSGGNGRFARILPSGKFQWFTLTTPVAKNAGLIHLAFDWHEYFNFRKQHPDALKYSTHRLWLLSTTLVADAGKSIDAVFSVLIDGELGRIKTQQSIALPTQRCYAHRVFPHRTGLFVSQMWVSSVAHITGAVAFHVEDVPGETVDVYTHVGVGVPHPRFTYHLELPKEQRDPTRMPSCPFLSGPLPAIHAGPLMAVESEAPSSASKPSTPVPTCSTRP
ncbi:hypothetical protein GOP47_0006808 [Adiantum capillus-veneris]|uniref:Uncharacterized protein n=1 Tax=Adiantum capillus-veneris TaxID=13818 RepID=A0A9D4V550_ADICA|nr:hypothetical protein GOP47_0006808 [Adiantum capillus-veneris]